MSQLQTLPFGLWPSPISPLLDGQSARLVDVQWDGDGQTLVWLERRNGRQNLVVKPAGAARFDLLDEWEPGAGLGYGGGDFGLRDGLIVYAERGGRLVRRCLGQNLPSPITPAFGAVSSPRLSPDGSQVVYCWSDGKIDALARVDSNGQQWPQKLRSHADFFMQPAWHPDGRKLAWIEWDHPHMPWDESRLMVAVVDGSNLLNEVKPLSAAAGQTACQPEFSPDGNWLSCLVSNGEWEDLQLWHLPDFQPRSLVQGEGFHLSTPAWVQGLRFYGWSADSRHLFTLRNRAGRCSLWQVEVGSGVSHEIPIDPYTWVRQLAVAPQGGQVAFIGSAPGVPERIVRWDGTALQVEGRSQPEALGPEWFSQPQPFSWPAPDGMLVHGLYFPPTHPHCRGNGLPPCIIQIHGGPSSEDPVYYDPEVAYFTSRGYAYAKVNYRGSSGYGRSYLRALDGRWGLADTEDAAGAARALVAQGLVDPAKLVLMGGSSGGYTVLNALIQTPELFKAGVVKYPVGNLFTLAQETHKFELHYLEGLVGSLPQDADRYREWSPVFHLHRLRTPLALFQGAEDKVVPPAQAEEIVAALRANRIPHIYRLYPGEGHGFRKTENIVDYYQSIERFLQQHVLFAP